MSGQEKIWITGASSGIGRALAISFANNGYKVFATARNSKKLDELNGNIFKKENVSLHSVDITSYQAIDLFASSYLKKEGLNCLINNAGITSFKKTEDNSLEEVDAIIQTNLLGAIYVTKAILPIMLEQGSGTIINILSVVTEKIFLQSSLYSASKAGLKAFASVLREEVRGRNIRVINIYPGATATNIWPEKSREKFGYRMMKPETIADIVLSHYKQSQNVVVEEIVLRPLEGDL